MTDGTYSLPVHFKQVFPELIAPPAQLEENETYYREATAYGRSDFRTLPEEMSPSDFCGNNMLLPRLSLLEATTGCTTSSVRYQGAWCSAISRVKLEFQDWLLPMYAVPFPIWT